LPAIAGRHEKSEEIVRKDLEFLRAKGMG